MVFKVNPKSSYDWMNDPLVRELKSEYRAAYNLYDSSIHDFEMTRETQDIKNELINHLKIAKEGIAFRLNNISRFEYLVNKHKVIPKKYQTQIASFISYHYEVARTWLERLDKELMTFIEEKNLSGL